MIEGDQRGPERRVAKREEKAGELCMITGEWLGKEALGSEKREVRVVGVYQGKVLSGEKARGRQMVSGGDREVSGRETTGRS